MELSVKNRFSLSTYLVVYFSCISFIVVSRFVPLNETLSLLLRSASFGLNLFLFVLVIVQKFFGQERVSMHVRSIILMLLLMGSFSVVFVLRYVTFGGEELRFLPLFFVLFSAIFIRDLFLLYPALSLKITLIIGYFFASYISLKLFNSSDSRLIDVLPNHSRNHLVSIAFFFITVVSILTWKERKTLLGSILVIWFSLFMILFSGTSGAISGLLILLSVMRFPFKLFTYLFLVFSAAIAFDLYFGGAELISVAQNFYYTDPRSDIWNYWHSNLTLESFLYGNSSQIMDGHRYTLHNSFLILFDWAGIFGASLLLLSVGYIFIFGDYKFKYLSLAFSAKFMSDTIFRSYDMWLAYNLIVLFAIKYRHRFQWKY